MYPIGDFPDRSWYQRDHYQGFEGHIFGVQESAPASVTRIRSEQPSTVQVALTYSRHDGLVIVVNQFGMAGNLDKLALDLSFLLWSARDSQVGKPAGNSDEAIRMAGELRQIRDEFRVVAGQRRRVLTFWSHVGQAAVFAGDDDFSHGVIGSGIVDLALLPLP